MKKLILNGLTTISEIVGLDVGARHIVCCFILSIVSAVTLAQEPIKIFIAADMEGIVGVVTDEQLSPEGFEYERFREFMTAEVNACIAAVREAGASEIVVADSHGNGQNLLIENLPNDVTIVRSWPRRLGMMAGIDSTFDGAIFLGFHTATTNLNGVRAHTMSSVNITAVRLNGIPMSEAGFAAATAGHFGVPIIMISGDDAVVEETQALIGDIEGAVVKWAHGFHSASTLTPEGAYSVIRKKAKAAIRRFDDFKPYMLQPPIVLEVSLKHYRPAELLDYLPGVERIDSHPIRFVGQDMVEVSNFLEFILDYKISLQP